jgi:hypothetical protein
LRDSQAGVSGWLEFHAQDIDLVKRLLGDSLKTITKSDFASHRVARFENAPESLLDDLTPFWGLFEWILDDENADQQTK